jgi:hypothetical protein
VAVAVVAPMLVAVAVQAAFFLGPSLCQRPTTTLQSAMVELGEVQPPSAMAKMVGHQVFLAPWLVCPRLGVVLAVRLIMPSLVAQAVVEMELCRELLVRVQPTQVLAVVVLMVEQVEQLVQVVQAL